MIKKSILLLLALVVLGVLLVSCVLTGKTSGSACTQKSDCQQKLSCFRNICQDFTSACTDTDNGQNLVDSKGKVSVSYAISGEVATEDTCVNSSTVTEFSCDSGDILQWNPINIPCPSDSLCVDGACVPQGCQDTDTKDDPHEWGTVTGHTTGPDFSAQSDSCDATGKLIQVGCGSSGELVRASMNCAVGETCQFGRCSAPGALGFPCKSDHSCDLGLECSNTPTNAVCQPGPECSSGGGC